MEKNFETNPFVCFYKLAQKGFVKGRNISETNRMIQDIIQYADEENEEGIIVFLDQQKAFDRVICKLVVRRDTPVYMSEIWRKILKQIHLSLWML
jgi:hypothetical protein